VFVDDDGNPLRPDTARRAAALRTSTSAHDDSLYGAWIHGILDSLRASGRHEILLRIHGGMTPLVQNAMDTVVTRTIMSETPYYPIYVDWESSIQQSYLDHLLHVRQGQAYRGFDPRGVPLAPLYFAADAGRALARAPVTWSVEFQNFIADMHGANGIVSPAAKRVQHALFDSIALAHVCDAPGATLSNAPRADLPRVEYGGECRSRSSRWLTFALGVATTVGVMPYPRTAGRIGHNTLGRFSLKLPTHLGWPGVKLFSPWASEHIAWIPFRPITSFLIDLAGTPGYAIMRRRTETMIRLAQEAGPVNPPLDYRPASGAVAQLLDSLQALVAAASPDAALPTRCAWSAVAPAVTRSAGAPYRVTIVAHSLGAVIAGSIVRGCPGIPFHNIVFMAAASTVAEFERDVLPYLRSDTTARFFNLTMNPAADRDEWPNGNWAATQGSMLAWADGLINTPATDADRVLGRYETAISSIHLIPDTVRARVFFKSFPFFNEFRNHGIPYRHSDFIHQPFWRCEYWTPANTRPRC
jgi:hypothetical protein